MKQYLKSHLYRNELFSKALENRARKVKHKQFVLMASGAEQYFIAG